MLAPDDFIIVAAFVPATVVNVESCLNFDYIIPSVIGEKQENTSFFFSILQHTLSYSFL